MPPSAEAEVPGGLIGQTRIPRFSWPPVRLLWALPSLLIGHGSECKVTVSLPAFVPQNAAYTGGVKGLREFIDWLRETLKGAVQPPRQLQPVPIPVRVRERR
jgi:hypothetical protein